MRISGKRVFCFIRFSEALFRADPEPVLRFLPKTVYHRASEGHGRDSCGGAGEGRKCPWGRRR